MATLSSGQADSLAGSNKLETVINISSSHLNSVGAQQRDKANTGGAGVAGGSGGSGGGSNAANLAADVDEEDDQKPPAPRSAARGSPLAAVLYIVTAVALVRN
jgi:hypothetical protein